MLALLLVTISLVTCIVAKQCQNFTIPVSISAHNKAFNIPAFENSLDATTFVQDVFNIGGNALGPTGLKTISGQYNISAQFCQPDSTHGVPILQFLIHGLGFDKT